MAMTHGEAKELFARQKAEDLMKVLKTSPVGVKYNLTHSMVLEAYRLAADAEMLTAQAVMPSAGEKITAKDLLRSVSLAVRAGQMERQCDEIAGIGAASVLQERELFRPETRMSEISLSADRAMRVDITSVADPTADNGARVSVNIQINTAKGWTDNPKAFERHALHSKGQLLEIAREAVDRLQWQEKTLLNGTINIPPGSVVFKGRDELMGCFTRPAEPAPVASLPREEQLIVKLTGQRPAPRRADGSPAPVIVGRQRAMLGQAAVSAAPQQQQAPRARAHVQRAH